MKKPYFALIWIMFAATTLAQSPRSQGRYDDVTQTTGSTAVTYKDYGHGEIAQRILTISWVADTETSNVLATIPRMWGELVRVVTAPGATYAPTDNYDITLTDADGADVLATLGGNRDAANTEEFVPLIGNGSGVHGATSPGGTKPITLGGDYTLLITDTDTSATGKLVLYLRQ